MQRATPTVDDGEHGRQICMHLVRDLLAVEAFEQGMCEFGALRGRQSSASDRSFSLIAP